MNKYLVEKYLKIAYDCMKDCPPNKSTSIRGQIATFGAAISSGSLLSAIAFFSNAPSSNESNSGGNSEKESNVDADKESAKEVRVYLLNMIHKVIKESEKQDVQNRDIQNQENLFDFVANEINNGNESMIEEKVLSAAIAVKLSINLFK